MSGLKFTDPSGKTVAQVPVVDRQISVGRAADVDVALPFKAISRYHAQFFPYEGQVWVEDLGSSNGVLVDGRRIAQATRVDPGNAVRIGVIDVQVVAPEPAVVPSQPRSPFAPPPPPAARPAPSPFSPPPPVMSSSGVDLEPPTRGRPEGHASASPPWPHGSQSSPQPQYGARSSPPSGSVPLGPSVIAEAAGPETSPEAPTVALPVTPRLIGLAGYLKDQAVYLDQPETTVGRVKGSHLVIEDASVSRNHAKIIQKDGSFVLFDLRSYNGCYVNDTQITKADLSHGDTVRFGDISFRFLLTNEPEGKAVKPRSPRRKRVAILAAVTLALGLVIVAINVIRHEEPPPPPPDPAERERELQAKIRMQLERGSTLLRQRDWEGASATLQGVLKLDPLNDEAVKGLETARLEREREAWLKEGERIADTDRDLERAVALFSKIPQESSYYADSSERLRQVNRSLADRARNRGLALCKSWRYEECQTELCRFFQTWPLGEPIPDEVRVRRALERAEERLKNRRDFVACAIPQPGTGDGALDGALTEAYPEEQIRRTVIDYTQGRADDAIHSLTLLEKNRRYREHLETINKLLQHMIRVQTASADAHRDVRADRLPEAEASYDVLTKADAKIMPQGFKSRYVREVGNLLGDSYHRMGSEKYRSGLLREAFKNWSRGKELAPNHPDVLQALLTLAGRAREICDNARSRLDEGDTTGAVSHFELCRDITPETSPEHQQAVDALHDLGVTPPSE
jgi:pSer/pThr/pTyr-binding forkhead associated (FHA) protein/tetratricopeptide (TPR) repeat protein